METTFKKRFSNHKKSFKFEKYGKETELSKKVFLYLFAYIH